MSITPFNKIQLFNQRDDEKQNLNDSLFENSRLNSDRNKTALTTRDNTETVNATQTMGSTEWNKQTTQMTDDQPSRYTATFPQSRTPISLNSRRLTMQEAFKSRKTSGDPNQLPDLA